MSFTALFFECSAFDSFLGALALNALQTFLTTREIWWRHPICGAALLVHITTVNLLTDAIRAVANISAKALDGAQPAWFPSLTAARSFAHPPINVGDEVVNTLQPVVTCAHGAAVLIVGPTLNSCNTCSRI
jgi:hypothetical protein